MFTAFINYKGVADSFNVADAGHGDEWARTRAIAHFFHRHPELHDFGARDVVQNGGSFRPVAAAAIQDGLSIRLLAIPGPFVRPL
jgi:hypothetical protein